MLWIARYKKYSFIRFRITFLILDHWFIGISSYVNTIKIFLCWHSHNTNQCAEQKGEMERDRKMYVEMQSSEFGVSDVNDS